MVQLHGPSISNGTNGIPNTSCALSWHTAGSSLGGAQGMMSKSVLSTDSHGTSSSPRNCKEIYKIVMRYVQQKSAEKICFSYFLGRC